MCILQLFYEIKIPSYTCLVHYIIISQSILAILFSPFLVIALWGEHETISAIIAIYLQLV